MEKGSTFEQIAEATRRLHEVGVRVAFFLQFGYPGETRDDLEKTLQMVRDCQPDDIGMSVSYPLPGTKFHNNVKLQLGDKQNWVDSADLEMMYQGPFTTAIHRQLHFVFTNHLRRLKHRREMRWRRCPGRGPPRWRWSLVGAGAASMWTR